MITDEKMIIITVETKIQKIYAWVSCELGDLDHLTYANTGQLVPDALDGNLFTVVYFGSIEIYEIFD